MSLGEGPWRDGGPDLGLQLKGSLLRIAGSMWNHGPHMWPKMADRGISVPSLETEEMSDLTSYLYYFQFIDSPGDATRGSVVYRDKRCGNCHGATSGSPASSAPPLEDVVEALSTPLDVVTQMWNHAGQMEGRMAYKNMVWPILKGGETSDLIAYLLSLRGSNSASSERR